MGPVIPGLSDDPAQLEAVVRACLDAGAVSIGVVLLHLRPGVKDHFLDQLAVTHPELLERYKRLYPRTYAPKAEQRRVSDLVHGFVRKHGGVRVVPRRRAPKVAVEASAPPAQLSLL